jgi:deoxyhypusine synthase
VSQRKPRPISSLADGSEDGLEALSPLDPARTDSVDALVRAMGKTAFGGRRLGEAADVLEAMVRDERCYRVITLSGAMTIAKQGLVLCEMIDRGWVDAIVSTGALMTHGLVEGAGMLHFKHRPDMDDALLYRKGYNRVYDTIELEKNLYDTEEILQRALEGVEHGETLASYRICERIGEELERSTEGRAILKSAHRRGVPVYVPAFSDCELGLDFALWNRARDRDGKKRIAFDPFLDLEHFTEQVSRCERMGIFTVGGGVPRNWAQQVAPYLEILSTRMHLDLPIQRYRYAVRICPEPEHWGGLSGCTYSEGVSWGKFVPESEGGRFAEVYADATIAWPLLVRAVLERLQGSGA